MLAPNKSFLTFPGYLGIEKKFQVAPALVSQFRISMEAETGLSITNSLVWKHKVSYFFFTFWPCGLWDLGSLTRDQTHTHGSGSADS